MPPYYVLPPAVSTLLALAVAVPYCKPITPALLLLTLFLAGGNGMIGLWILSAIGLPTGNVVSKQSGEELCRQATAQATEPTVIPGRRVARVAVGRGRYALIAGLVLLLAWGQLRRAVLARPLFWQWVAVVSTLGVAAVLLVRFQRWHTARLGGWSVLRAWVVSLLSLVGVLSFRFTVGQSMEPTSKEAYINVYCILLPCLAILCTLCGYMFSLVSDYRYTRTSANTQESSQ